MTESIFEVLKMEHKGVKDILAQLDKTTAPKKREQLFKKVEKELVPHMKAEESSFYKLLLAKKDARDASLEALEEHHVTEMVLQELGELSKDDERWGAKLVVFKEMLEHHIEEEETTVFKKARGTLGKKEIQEIGESFDREEQKIKKNFK